jgi:hypothetical protein
MSDHTPHIIPTRRDVEIAELERENQLLRAELSSNTGQLDNCRRLLREAVLRDGLCDERWFEQAWKASGESGRRCTCHERDSSYACDYCHHQGIYGHMEQSLKQAGGDDE